MRSRIALCLWIALTPASACSPTQLGGAQYEAPQVQGGGMRPVAAPEAAQAEASPSPASTAAVHAEASRPPAQGAPETSPAPAAANPSAPQASNATNAPNNSTPDDQATAAIIGVHGGAGPWVVAGYRMGAYALRKLNLAKGSFDLEVTHHAPHEVQYSCIADGAAAATGASLGRLSLSLVETPAPETRTTYRKRSTGEQLTLRTTPEFAARYKDVPRPQLMAAGQEVLHLKDAEIFYIVP